MGMLSWDEAKELLMTLLSKSDDEAGDVLNTASWEGYARTWGGKYLSQVDHGGECGFTLTILAVRGRV
jgi:hypothetical protein